MFNVGRILEQEIYQGLKAVQTVLIVTMQKI